MTREIFIELYLDEDVDVLVAALLSARGYAVHTALSTGKLGATDAEQLETATELNAAIVTHNRVDFEQLAITYHQSQRTHDGMVIASRHRPQEIARRLLVILDSTTADEMKDQLIYI